MPLLRFVVCLFAVSISANTIAGQPLAPLKAKRIVFLGDSNTHAGHFVHLLDVRFRTAGSKADIINLGLPSETCCGLSEPTHPFPRPTVQERIDRVLAKTKPDLVVACYGINDGIYHPFSEQRFLKYQQGIDEIIEKVRASGAKLVLMTPPPFDPTPLSKAGRLKPDGADVYSWESVYENYDDVMKKYSDWIMAQRGRVEMVIDLHRAVSDYMAKKRESDPSFSMSPDGVHVNHEGHEVIAAAILSAWNVDIESPIDPKLMKQVTQSQNIMHAAWLSEVGHQRPGVAAGLPVNEARQKVHQIFQD